METKPYTVTCQSEERACLSQMKYKPMSQPKWQNPKYNWDLLIMCTKIGQYLSYCQMSNISYTKSQDLNVSLRVLQLSLPNLLKPGVKSRMKM